MARCVWLFLGLCLLSKSLSKMDTFVNATLVGVGPISQLGSVRFKVDGASCGGFGRADIGGFLCDSSNWTLILFFKSVGVSDATTAEILAIRVAYIMFQGSPWLHTCHLRIECDCSMVVSWFHNPPKSPSIFKQIIQE
ncbi:hypothetical protein V6N12_028552 [Hibiscus sabdariffa]|uniref:RNase H type-1 domain-containing protein n=1 Tax=Hibiscus sabdariffa TaxID=183260 RepID=A0ABR2F665_9ROSI